MKLELTDKELSKLKQFINDYREINDNFNFINDKLKEYKDKLSQEQERVHKLKEDEDKFMKRLHRKYGDFSLQDLNFLIYEQ